MFHYPLVLFFNSSPSIVKLSGTAFPSPILYFPTPGRYILRHYIRGHIDKFCLQVHNFGNNEDKQMILTPNERSFYLAPDDISFFNIITVPFDTEPPPTDDLLDAVSEEVSSLVSSPRKNGILHIFVCLVTVALEVILEFWKKEEIARSKIWAIRRVR